MLACKGVVHFVQNHFVQTHFVHIHFVQRYFVQKHLRQSFFVQSIFGQQYIIQTIFGQIFFRQWNFGRKLIGLEKVGLSVFGQNIFWRKFVFPWWCGNTNLTLYDVGCSNEVVCNKPCFDWYVHFDYIFVVDSIGKEDRNKVNGVKRNFVGDVSKVPPSTNVQSVGKNKMYNNIYIKK